MSAAPTQTQALVQPKIQNIGGRPGYTWGITLNDHVLRHGLCLPECPMVLEDVVAGIASGAIQI